MQRAARAQAIVSGSKRLDCHCSIDEPNTPAAKRLLRRPNVQRGPGATGGGCSAHHRAMPIWSAALTRAAIWARLGIGSAQRRRKVGVECDVVGRGAGRHMVASTTHGLVDTLIEQSWGKRGVSQPARRIIACPSNCRLADSP